MKDLLRTIETVALALGGPGLFLIAYLDSSFLSFPQANDLLIIWMVLKRQHLMLFYASMATLGSLAGCLTIYLLARKGGEAFVRRRFKEGHVEHGLALFRKYGVLAIVIPALLPPPAPFKLFVLLAGVAGVPPVKFTLATLVGRGARYFAIGFLTLWYGEAAIAFLKTHGRMASVIVVGLVALGALGWYWRQRTKRPQAPV
jgi:membrane protein YqaA with SNARE-associated domain